MIEKQDNLCKLWQNILKNADKTKPHYTILLPPPNITGSLHIGHFLNWSLQDCLMRKAYINGFYPNWITGIDHAGIATEFIAKRELEKEGKDLTKITTNEIKEKILAWKEISSKLIEEQALELGFFFDWSLKQFTMDEKYQEHVKYAFIKLYEDGLVKKNKRITNWDPTFKTALSDLEIIEKIEKRKIYLIKYEGENEDLIVATTMPETIFADSALCVHPEDERYKHIKAGTKFKIPLINKEIPLIKDELCQIEKGTGVLKVTPAHSQLDYIIGEKHNLEIVEILDKRCTLFNVPKEFENLTRKEAKPLVLAALEKNGNFIEEQDWEGTVPYGEKSIEPIETILTEQWFLDVSQMAKNALNAIEEKKIEFIPDYIKETFAYWMNNIKPWCISRQISWGHKISIWYKKDSSVICANNLGEAQKKANTTELREESDVLDTWFSSALWPIATQHDDFNDIKKFIPSDVLITGKDILFFWVSRMIMFSLYFTNEIPFKKVFFNGIVRDNNKQKMSKTKGNVLNPLDIQKEYGNDSLRFALFKKSSFSKDINIQISNIEEGRAFCTKIRNATRFINEFLSKTYNPNKEMDNWMETKIYLAKKDTNKALERFAFNEAINIIYDLFWNNFCSWYIEGQKLYPSEKAKQFLIEILKIMHPLLPFISEECYNNEQDSILNLKELNLTEYNNHEFEETIKISKLLRKMKLCSGLKEFHIPNKEKENIVKLFSKLNINEKLDFNITIENTKIFMPKICAQNAKIFIEKEKNDIENEFNIVNSKIKNQNNVPENIILEWIERKENLEKKLNELNQWINNLN